MESIAYHVKDDFGYAFVQFDSAESATKAMAKYRHNISGKTVKAKAAHNHHQNQTRFVVPDADSPCNILNKLNEYCLMEIFMNEDLSVADLCSVGNVCSDFRAVAKRVFSIKSPVISSNDIPNWSLFRLFGPEIKSIELDFDNEGVANRMLGLMATYCSGPTFALNRIKIWDWKMKAEFIEGLKPIFSRIQVLNIYVAPNDGTVFNLLSNCNELIDLQLACVDFGGISKIVFPKLESLHIEETSGLNDYIINRFSESHPQLKKLTIESWSGKLTPKAFRNLGLNLSEFHLLGNIEISTPYVDSMLDHIKRLKNLKSLVLNCSSLPADRVLTALIEGEISLGEIHLTNFKYDSTFSKGIKALKHLKMIKFSNGDWEDENLFVEMVKSLPQLQSIYLDNFGDVTVEQIKVLVKLAPKLEHIVLGVTDGESMDCDDFTSILKSVKGRPNQTKLKIELYCCLFKLNIPEIMQKESREWLEIEINVDNDDGWLIDSDTDSDIFYFSDYFNSDYDYDSDDIYDHWPLFF